MVKSVELLQEPNKFVAFDNFDLVLTSWLVCCSCLLKVEKFFSLAFFFFPVRLKIALGSQVTTVC